MSDGHCSKGDRKKGVLSLGGERKSERASPCLRIVELPSVENRGARR